MGQGATFSAIDRGIREVMAVPVNSAIAVPRQSQKDVVQSQLKLLITKGKEQGYLTHAEVHEYLPSEIVDPEQIEDIFNLTTDLGVPVYESAPEVKE